MAAGNWVDWNTGDLVTAASFQDIQDSIVFIYADETAANAALTNKVEGTVFYDTTNNLLKAWDGAQWISAETGDISAVTAGDGLSGGGSSGDVTLDLDLNELTAASVDVANDSIPIVDATDNSSKKESIADLATAMADGSTITASAGVLSAAASGGLSAAQQWRLTANITATGANFITSNLEVPDTENQGNLGTAVTESSGVFSFSETGFYLILVNWTGYVSTGYNILATWATDDNSTYNQIATGQFEAPGNLNSQASAAIIDVTNTTNDKVKFQSHLQNAGSYILGSTSFNYTSFTFIRLGDT